MTSQRLVAYAMLLFLVIALVQVTASLVFYETIDRDALYEDHARRVAELLVVSDRVHRHDPRLTAQIMSSHYLDARIMPVPSHGPAKNDDTVSRIRDHIVKWEPALGSRTLLLDILPGKGGARDLVGSMRLSDGNWLHFRSRDISSALPTVARAAAITLAITMLSVALGLGALFLLTTPLRQLTEAASRLTGGQAPPIEEHGTADVRSLARSFNEMRSRIAHLENDQSRSFEAISHDLRTPLSRLSLAADLTPDDDISRIVRSSAEEMEGMLMSLQRFLRAQHLESEIAPVDLTALANGLVDRFGANVHLEAPTQIAVLTYPLALTLALEPLVENALQYGSSAEITVRSAGDDWLIEIADDGPGITEDCFQAVLDPFFRGDEARARNTPGFGLGIPTAHRLLTRFGGDLRFRKASSGGTIVSVVVPRPAST